MWVSGTYPTYDEQDRNNSPKSEFSYYSTGWLNTLPVWPFCISSAWRGGFTSSQWPGHGADQRTEYGAAEKQQRLPAVLQWIQHRDHNPILLRGHNPFTRWNFNLLYSAAAFNLVQCPHRFLLATVIVSFFFCKISKKPTCHWTILWFFYWLWEFIIFTRVPAFRV